MVVVVMDQMLQEEGVEYNNKLEIIIKDKWLVVEMDLLIMVKMVV